MEASFGYLASFYFVYQCVYFGFLFAWMIGKIRSIRVQVVGPLKGTERVNYVDIYAI